MQIKNAVVLKFKQLCETKGITYNQLANMSGVTPSTVYSMFDPERKDLSIITIKKLCDGIDISISDFFDDDLFRYIEQEMQ